VGDELVARPGTSVCFFVVAAGGSQSCYKFREISDKLSTYLNKLNILISNKTSI
jgi:hypothetical protein